MKSEDGSTAMTTTYPWLTKTGNTININLSGGSPPAAGTYTLQVKACLTSNPVVCR